MGSVHIPFLYEVVRNAEGVGDVKLPSEVLEKTSTSPVGATCCELTSDEENGRIWIRTKDLVVISDAL